MVTQDTAIVKVARILGVHKAAWSRVGQCRKNALADGFTDEDFIKAAENMAKADKKYHSIYSVFIKTDYWLNQNSEPEAPKGVW